MKILHVKSKQYEEAQISLIQKRDLSAALKKRFGFDWKKEEQFDIYKLTKVNDKNILGLMSLFVIRSEFRVEIRLLEAAKPNIGTEKEYDRIAGCLIGFACRLSFKLGFGGFV